MLICLEKDPNLLSYSINFSLRVKKKRQQSMVWLLRKIKIKITYTIHPDTHLLVGNFSSVNGAFAAFTINSVDRIKSNIRTQKSAFSA